VAFNALPTKLNDCLTDPDCITVAMMSGDMHCCQTMSIAEIKVRSAADECHHEAARFLLRCCQRQWRLYIHIGLKWVRSSFAETKVLVNHSAKIWV